VTTTLVLTALNHALRSHDVRTGELIFYGDEGAQYTALRFTQPSSTPGWRPQDPVLPEPRHQARRGRPNPHDRQRLNQVGQGSVRSA
jgi:hypothetical protein